MQEVGVELAEDASDADVEQLEADHGALET